jgi:hypothetical protein
MSSCAHTPVPTLGEEPKASTTHLFSDNGATKALAQAHPITVPVLAVDGASHPFTENTFRQVAAGQITGAHFQAVGHLVAQKAPEQLAAAILEFTGPVDAEQLRSDAIS